MSSRSGRRARPEHPEQAQHDVPGIQRALFRMQLDPSFAARVFDGEPAAIASTGLGEPDLALLHALDPVALAADRDDRRVAQLCGNLATEFPRSVAWLTAQPGGEARLRSFVGDASFHAAIADEEPLPLAFAAWIALVAGAEEPFAALVRLEATMAHARRRTRAMRSPDPGEFALAPACRLVEVRDGTLAWAATFDAGDPHALVRSPLAPREPATGTETLLIQAVGAPDHQGRRDVAVERLEAAVAGLLTRLVEPAALSDVADWAASIGATSADLAAFADELVADGVLASGVRSAEERDAGL